MSDGPRGEPVSDAPRPGGDALTVAFSAVQADVHGVARLGVSPEGVSGLVLLFHGGEPVAVAADGGVAPGSAPASWDEVSADGGVAPGSAPASWDEVSAAGVDHETREDGWAVSWAGDAGAFDLVLRPLGVAADVPDGTEQALAIAGTADVQGRRLAVQGRGQRTRSWAAPDWERTELARTVQVWLPDRAIAASAVRARGRAHGEEDLRAVVLEHATDPPAAVEVADPRLSTTYDAEGRQRHAGLELWVAEDGPLHRVAGEAFCGTTLDLGRMRLDTAFFRWRAASEEGTGRYDVLRRTG